MRTWTRNQGPTGIIPSCFYTEFFGFNLFGSTSTQQLENLKLRKQNQTSLRIERHKVQNLRRSCLRLNLMNPKLNNGLLIFSNYRDSSTKNNSLKVLSRIHTIYTLPFSQSMVSFSIAISSYVRGNTVILDTGSKYEIIVVQRLF